MGRSLGMKDINKKYTIIFILSVVMMSFLALASFAFLGNFQRTLNNTNVNILAQNVNNTYFNVTNNVSFSLDVDPTKMNETNNGNYVAENTAILDVSINLAADGLSVKCTYDIIFEYDSSSNIYGVSPTPVTTGASKELTLQAIGSNGTSDYFEEKNFNLTSRKKTIVSGAEIVNSIADMPTTHRWKFVNRFYNLNLDQSALANKSFKGRYYVANVSCDKSEDKTIYSLVKKRYKNNDKYVKLYSESDASTYANPVYYFNGAVTNNNVLFGGFCCKMVRTTDTGGIKMVYNGVQTNGSCNNTGDASQIGTSVFNSNSNSPAYVGYMYNTIYTYSYKSMSSESNIIFGNTFIYANGKYILSNLKTVETWSSGYNTINSTHYTCFTTDSTCEEVYYVYYTNSDNAYYITLTDGKRVDDAINEMLYADDVNKTDSKIKSYIDSWYKDNMTSFTDKLEDTIFCNDRTILNKNGWDSNGGDTSAGLTFKNAKSNYSLACTNETDRFSMSNSKAKLTYPIGLLSAPEVWLAYRNASLSTYYLRSRNDYWIITPKNWFYESLYITSAMNFYVRASGALQGYSVSFSKGVKPVISLKPGTEYTSGDGSYTNPFVVS